MVVQVFGIRGPSFISDCYPNILEGALAIMFPLVQTLKAFLQLLQPDLDEMDAFGPDLQSPSILLELAVVKLCLCVCWAGHPHQTPISTDQSKTFRGSKPPERLQVFRSQGFDELKSVEEPCLCSLATNITYFRECARRQRADDKTMNDYFGRVVCQMKVACLTNQ